MCCWQLPTGKPAPLGMADPRGKAGCVSHLARCGDFDAVVRHGPGVRVAWEVSELGGGREGTVPSQCLSNPSPQGRSCRGNLPCSRDRRVLGWLMGTRGSWQSGSDGVCPLENQSDSRS